MLTRDESWEFHGFVIILRRLIFAVLFLFFSKSSWIVIGFGDCQSILESGFLIT